MTTDSRPPKDCEITYTAMRAAFVSTLDCLLRYALDPDSVSESSSGFLSCFPMLNGMAPQIQMECLLRTWQRLPTSAETPELLDELVVYAALESLAGVTSDKQSASLRVVLNGPRVVSAEPVHWLHSKTRCMQIAGPTPRQTIFLRELQQIEDPCPWLESEMGANWCENREELLDLVGRWVAQKDLILGSEGLLTRDEQDILRAFFEEHPGLAR